MNKRTEELKDEIHDFKWLIGAYSVLMVVITVVVYSTLATRYMSLPEWYVWQLLPMLVGYFVLYVILWQYDLVKKEVKGLGYA